MAKSKKTRGRAQTNPLLYIGALLVVTLIAVGVVMQWPAVETAVNLPPEISVGEAAEKWDDGVFLLDVREPSEWADVHVPGSTLIPLGELASRASEVPADQEILVICRSGNRSATGRDILLEAGLTRVTSVAGGIRAWQTAGNPVVSSP